MYAKVQNPIISESYIFMNRSTVVFIGTKDENGILCNAAVCDI